MTITTLAASLTTDASENAYLSGYTEGELDALEKLPAHIATNRAALADQYDPLWAQGYSDGFLDEIARNAALIHADR